MASDPPVPVEGEVDRPPGLRLSRHTSDVDPPSHPSLVYGSGVVHARRSDGSVVDSHHYIADVGLWPILTNFLQSDFGLDEFTFTPYSSPTAWTNTFGASTPLSNIITSQTFLQEVMQRNRTSRGVPPSQQTAAPPQQPPANLFSPPGILRKGQYSQQSTIPVTPATTARGSNTPLAAPGQPAPSGLSGLAAALAGGTAPLAGENTPAAPPAPSLRVPTPFPPPPPPPPPAPPAPAPPAPPAPAVPAAQPQQQDPPGQNFMAILQQLAATMNPTPQEPPTAIPPPPPAPPTPPPAPPVPPAPQQPPTPPPQQFPPNMDTNMMAMFLLLQQQQQAMQQAMQDQTRQLAASISNRRVTAPSISWPKWDGSTAGIPAFVEQLKTLQQDPYFRGADWTQKLPGFDDQSNWLRASILQNLPAAELHRFMNRPDFETDGFAMFAHLMN